MFGFVTFVYPETVKSILAKGNPHFVCDSRVLVKPYKEKGKVPDKYRYYTLILVTPILGPDCSLSPCVHRTFLFVYVGLTKQRREICPQQVLILAPGML